MIEISGLYKSFGELEVLKDINIRIEDKEIFGIIGQSGAGKSTLLRCINGLEKINRGSININGVKVEETKGKDLRVLQKQMGMIFQNFNLLNRLSVYDNVALPLKFWGINTTTPEAKAKIEGLLKLVDLLDKKDARPRELSGGQKQRVAIARALVLDPKVLLCDEATSALDPKITREILDLLQKINREMGITIIVVTHQMEVVKQICEKIVFLKDGRVLAEGKPEELFVHPIKEMKSFLQEESNLLPEKGVNIQIFFSDSEESGSNEPVITQMARYLDVDFSIVWGKLEDFRSSIYGSLVINIASETDADKIKDYLSSKNVYWEVL